MNTSDRGLKHVCPECATKYYDLRKEVVTCPKCSAKPPAAKLRMRREAAGREVAFVAGAGKKT